MTTGGQPPYAGDLSAQAAWEALADDARTVLVDVRTAAEWTFVGAPDLSALGKQTVFAEWQTWPTMVADARFVPALASRLEAIGAKPDDRVIFICRSGARSKSAAVAMTAAGWTRSFNLDGGFEGALDSDHHRGGIGGWKAAGLPWVQS